MTKNFLAPVLAGLLSVVCAGAFAAPLTYQYRQAIPGFSAPSATTQTPAPAAAILEKVSPAASSLTFGDVAVGTTGPQVITLRNGAPAGANPLTVTTTGLSGAFSVLTNTCSAVPGQGTCTISVGYTPSTTGAAVAQTLQLTPTEGTPLSLSTQGTGTGDPYWSYVTALYKYDANQTTVANAKTANAGYALYSSIYSPSGKFGGAGGTNGASYIYGSNYTFHPTGTTPFAVETWLKFTGTPAITAGGTFQGATVFSREGDGSDIVLYFARWPVLAGGMPSHLCFQWDYSIGGYRTGYVCSLVTVGLNEWHHVAVSYSGSGRVPLLFLDGQQLSTSVTNPTNLEIGITTVTTGGFELGYRNAANYNGYFTGVFDDTRFTVGAQRYTTSFQPPSVPLPAY